jgi:DNA-binding HxlR family transcriptional regulator
MREYGQYCPVALGSEVLADRWTPLILREMVLGSTRFNDIERGLPRISRSLLLDRLRYLERRGVVQRVPAAGGRGHEYHLTPAGEDLELVIMAIGEWAVRWIYTEPEPHQVDPVTLTWWMHRRIDVDRMPDRRVVIQFAYLAERTTQVWLILDRGEPSVCINHPGFDPDVIVTTDALVFTRVFAGLDSWADAVSAGRIRIDGLPSLVRAFPRWFLWSPFAPAVRARSVSLTYSSTMRDGGDTSR